jgi:predicted NBD/HSP70 family sugar kinase
LTAQDGAWLSSSTPRLDGRRRLISTLSEFGALSRAELARRTALAPSTISALTADLLRDGLIVERTDAPVPAAGPRGGRPATLLALNRSAGLVVGIDFGKRHLRVAVADRAHELIAEQSTPLDPDQRADRHIRSAVTLVHATLDRANAHLDHIVGVGMGLPGPINRATSQIGDSAILPGWVGVHAAKAMSAALGLPVNVDNDANLGALAEWIWGAARGCSELAYIKAATGIGAGLIINGRPFAGYGGTAGEIGHTIIDPSGPICRCGNRGCLEMLAGTPAILAALQPTHPQLTSIAEVIARAQDGDTGCARALTDSGRAIGTALATLCNLINPQRIIVGGELGAAGSLLLDPIRDTLDRGAIRSAGQDVTLCQSTLGERAEVLGAVALALTHLGHAL